jgi:tetratricopeptide (TPR) repeat protein
MKRSISLAAARVGLVAAPRCVATTDLQGPGVLGVFSPVVVLPLALEETLSLAELESILIHEFIHLRRRDNFWSALQTLFLSLFWFNPVVWLLNRSINLETEKSCDECVLKITADPATYVGGIVKAARHSLGLPQPGFVGAASLPVVSRIKSILAFGSRVNRPLVRIAALATGCLFAVLSVYAGGIAEGSSGPGNSNGPGDQQQNSPQMSGETKQAFSKVTHLLDAKDYDGVLALLKGLEPSVDKDSYDWAVIIDTEAKVLWQGKNRPADSIKPWEELLQLTERHPNYLAPKDRIAHLQYLAQTYYLAATDAKLKDEALKSQDIDKSMAYMKRWLGSMPKLSQDDLLFYASLLYTKATEIPSKVDMALLREAQQRAEEGSLLTAEPKKQFYQLLAAIYQQEGEWVPAAAYLERVVILHPTRSSFQDLIDSYIKLASQSEKTPELHQEYLDRAVKARQRAQALGIDLN